MKGRSRFGKIHEYKVEELDPTNVPEEHVGAFLVREADEALAVKLEEDDRQPAYLGLFRKSGLVLFLAGYNIPLGRLEASVGEVLERVFGLKLRDTARPGEEVEVDQATDWNARWFESEHPERLFERLRLLPEFGVPMRYEENS